MALSGAVLVQAFFGVFFAILFLQSGIDKVVDRKGNLDWLTGHFANSPLKNMVSILLITITLVELLAGIASIGTIIGAFFSQFAILTLIGPSLCCTALCMLFFGQRMAKDYAGAATLAPYFVGATISLLASTYM